MHILFLFGVGVQKLFVGIEDPFFEVGQSFVQSAVHEAVSVKDHAVEYEVFGLYGAVSQLVYYELAVDESIDVEAFNVPRDGEM